MTSHNIPLRFDLLAQERSLLFQFGIPSLLVHIIPIPINWLSQTLLIQGTANGYAQMGIFNAALQWRLSILFIPTALGGMITAMLSHARRHLFLYSLTVNLGISTTAAL